ncbi:MAG: YqgE/AlgH family protein [Alphaproteobacteria bacterium]|jgi:putative transcriptional regulator
MTQDRPPEIPESQTEVSDLIGQFLIAMPHMRDENFARTVVFLCAYGEDGAMGIIVNRKADGIDFDELLDQISIEIDTENGTEQERLAQIPVHNGGPVETGRGFVLHSQDYLQRESVQVTDAIAMTASVEILRSIAEGKGPRNRLLALGYAGWSPGQLESEIQANGWLVTPAEEDILFGPDLDAKWTQALKSMGVNPAALSGSAGRA